jgi:hypothetical protein
MYANELWSEPGEASSAISFRQYLLSEITWSDLTLYECQESILELSKANGSSLH